MRFHSTLVPLFALATAANITVEAFAGCCSCPPPSSQVVIACDRDGGYGDSEVADEEFDADTSEEALGRSTPCARACAKMAELGCPESKKPAGGRTCVETCKAIRALSSFDPECVAAAKTVTAARKCPAFKCAK